MDNIVPFKNPLPDRVSAQKTLDSFEAGYIDDPNHPDVIAAGEVLGKKARIKTYPSIANPQIKLEVRSVGGD